jgi:hypothetical protein
MAGTGTRIEQGWQGSGTVASGGLAANTGVKWDTDGKLAYAAAGDRGIGSVQEAFAAGAVANFYRKMGGAWLAFSGTLVAGDYAKFTTGGILVADTTSGSTALSANTVGLVREINAGAGLCFMEWV